MAGKGVVVRWERMRRQNHWFDALYNACAAGQALGVRLVQEKVAEPKSRRARVPGQDGQSVSVSQWFENWRRPRW